MHFWLTGQLADKPNCSQWSRWLLNSQTSQLTDGKLFGKLFLNNKSTKLYFTLNLDLTVTITLLTIESVE